MLCTGNQSEMAQKWAKWQHHPCLLGGPQCSARGSNLKCPQVGKAATTPQRSWGSPMLCTGNQSEMAHKWAKWQHHPSLLGGPQCSTWGSNLKWPTSGQSGYITPASWGSPMLCKGANIRDGLQVGKAATSALPSSGSPMLCTGNKSEMAHKWAERQHHPFGLGVPNALHGDQS